MGSKFLRIDAIRALLSRVGRGEVEVGEWRGREAQLTAQWAHAWAPHHDVVRSPGLLAIALRLEAIESGKPARLPARHKRRR